MRVLFINSTRPQPDHNNESQAVWPDWFSLVVFVIPAVTLVTNTIGK